MEFRGLQLDTFQEQATKSIDKDHSVLVAAPTGSGKTLTADYIIDTDLKEGKRVIYTGPIKALTNQKYRDFVEQYGEGPIGLITGDVVINPRAQILVMTTEIYRNMAVVKDPVLDDVSYCIMDEIHFINDEERGYIWEESIMFSPDHIRFLFLSATIPNAEEFAAWVRKIKGHEVIVIRHDKRPVPLRKAFYDGEWGLVSMGRLMKEASIPEYHQARGSRRRPMQKPPWPDFMALLRELRGDGRLPAIYFVFSRKKTQEYALKISATQDFLSNEEKRKMASSVAELFTNISNEVTSLKSTMELRQCLAKGVAFHHAGLLPDIKHIVEQLFSKGLVKVLFATETFAVGINMPAKTVVFDSLRKFTGTGFRYVNSKEYFQISGRAGRRGMDEEGLSIALLRRPGDDIFRIRRITKADTMPIRSQFKLTYNTVLNMVHLHSVEEIEQILQMSFFAFQQGKRGTIRARYDKIIKTLTGLGYIKDNALTDLGIFTTKVYSNEIEVSQVFATGFREKIDERAMLLVLAALVYEERKDDEFINTYPSTTSRDLMHALASHQVLGREKWHRNIEKLTALIEPLFAEQKFIDILENTTKPEGDLIRFFMQLLDKLEQIDRASQDGRITEIARGCKQRIREALEGIHTF